MDRSASNFLHSLFSKITSKQSQFTKAILSGNLELSRSLGFDLYHKQPNYLIFFYLATLDKNKGLLLRILKHYEMIDPHLIYILLNSKEFSYSDLAFLENKVDYSTFIGLCIKREFFLKKYSLFEEKKEETTQENNNENTNISCLSEIKKSYEYSLTNNTLYRTLEGKDLAAAQTELIKLIDKIDDFKLYDFAIKNNIEIPERDCLNYSWYKLLISADKEVAKNLILSSTNFDDITRIINIIPEIKTEDVIYDILIQYLLKGYSKDLLLQAYKLYESNTSFIVVKVLLALLISSKDESYIILALYVSVNFSSSTNYEVKLINLFLNRYFCLFSNITQLFTELEVKNIQQHNLAYVWSDPMICRSITLNSNISDFQKELDAIQVCISSNLRQLIESGSFGVALSSVRLSDRLFNSEIQKEIKNLKILTDKPCTMFSTLLGPHCSYLFSKLTINDKLENKGMVATLLSHPIERFDDKIFYNDICPITDKEFIAKLKSKLIKR